LLYSLSIHLYSLGIRIASLWNPKARLWINGRKDWRTRYVQLLERSTGKKKLWIHCASLGEFEQGRPVLEAIKNHDPNVFVILSFFSPSGYEIRKNYDRADAVLYLPPDTVSNAREFLTIIDPQLVIFVKYEYWLHYLEEMYQRKIPVLMVSAIFRPGQIFFRWSGQRWRKVLHKISHFFVQDSSSVELLEQAGVKHYTLSGDTRFDRVIAIRDQFSPIDLVEQFCGDAKVVVAGSTWEEDEEVWDHYANIHPETRFIIAPHEVYEGHLKSIAKLFKGSTRYSGMVQGRTNGNAHVLVIDNIGMLSKLYHYADITYVGGGFGNGIHNILEAAVHGKPVIFGPEYEKFREAVDMLDLGAAFTVSSALELEKTVSALMMDDELRTQACQKALQYVKSKAGATEKILTYIQENRLLTS
jgi:3-deoxy-D-manno-octulosonic-acid transferase